MTHIHVDTMRARAQNAKEEEKIERKSTTDIDKNREL